MGRQQQFIANEETRQRAGHPSMQYVATLINPVDKRLYDVVHMVATGDVYIVSPLPNSLYKDEDTSLQVYGIGSFDEYVDIELYYDGSTETYYRSHTPSGVVKKKAGLGLVLYSGLSLTAKTVNDAGGVFSRQESRSDSATKWWKAQVQRGYAEEEVAGRSGFGTITVDVEDIEDKIDLEELANRGYFGDEMEEAEDLTISEYDPSYIEVGVYVDGSIHVEFLPAEKVAESKLVVAWNTDETDLDVLLSNYVELPPPEIVAELDLSTVGDANLILNLWTVLNDFTRVTAAQKKKFVEHIPASLSTVPDILELMGQERLPFEDDLVAEASEVAANPRPKTPKHTKAWNDFFGDLAQPV